MMRKTEGEITGRAGVIVLRSCGTWPISGLLRVHRVPRLRKSRHKPREVKMSVFQVETVNTKVVT